MEIQQILDNDVIHYDLLCNILFAIVLQSLFKHPHNESFFPSAPIFEVNCTNYACERKIPCFRQADNLNNNLYLFAQSHSDTTTTTQMMLIGSIERIGS